MNTNDLMNGSAVLPATTDIAIIGGGMVGLSFAIVLAKQAPDAAITLIEAFPFGGKAGEEELRPSFDARSTALSASTRDIFDRAGLWQRLTVQACPIETIHVSDRGHPGVTRISAAESGLDALGHVVENRCLGRELMAAVRDRGNIQVLAPAKVEGLTPFPGGMELLLGAGRCRASLAVVADGANSFLLQQLGIHTRSQDYGQTALIANIALAQPHGGTAYERFTDEGPMALLPLPDSGGEHRAALVWTLEPGRGAQLLTAGEDEFLAELHQRFGFRAGRFLRCGERAAYPLQLLTAEEQVRSALAVVGNAAHFLHPVAGQGFNLALRDVAKLAEVLAEALSGGEPPGSLPVLERYLAAQARDQRNTIGFSHSLPAIFGIKAAPAIALRNAGLVALDLLSPLRQEFARFGAGLGSPAARRLDQP